MIQWRCSLSNKDNVTYPELTPEQVTAYAVNKSNSRRLWLERAWRRNPRCHYCHNKTTWEPGRSSQPGRNPLSMHATLDHRLAKSRGGVDHPSNWVLACCLCNHLKGDMSAAEYVAELMKAGVR